MNVFETIRTTFDCYSGITPFEELVVQISGPVIIVISFLFCWSIPMSMAGSDSSDRTPGSPKRPTSTDGFSFKGTQSILFVLDCSSTMRQLDRSGTRSQLDLAKDVLERVDRALPEGCNCGLRVFGQSDLTGSPEVDCKASQIAVPMNSKGRRQIKGLIKSFAAHGGMSCLAFALNKAISDVSDSKKPATIFLITNEKDTCGGDLSTRAWRAELREHGIRLVVFSTNNGLKEKGNCRTPASSSKKQTDNITIPNPSRSFKKI